MIDHLAKAADPQLEALLANIRKQALGVLFTSTEPTSDTVPPGKIVVWDDGSTRQIYIRTGDGNIIQLGNATVAVHASTHENGGADEIDVTGLSGLLADAQTPTAHASTHELSGSDPIDSLGTLTTTGRLKAVTTKTGAYTLTTTDEVVVGNSTTIFTLTLPAATGSGRHYCIKNINTAIVTVDGDSSDTIDGSTTIALAQWDSIQIIDYTANAWVIV